MIIRILGLISVVAVFSVIIWINPGSILVAALVILPYLLLLMVVHYQCIRLIQHMTEAYQYRETIHPLQTQPNVQTEPNIHRRNHLQNLIGLIL